MHFQHVFPPWSTGWLASCLPATCQQRDLAENCNMCLASPVSRLLGWHSDSLWCGSVLLQYMFSSQVLWQGGLEGSDKLGVLQQQMERLSGALEKATKLVSKWSKPMLLDKAVRFLKSNLDEEDILEVSEISLRWTQRTLQSCPSVQGGHVYPCFALGCFFQEGTCDIMTGVLARTRITHSPSHIGYKVTYDQYMLRVVCRVVWRGNNDCVCKGASSTP
jgi:hypothetical protein